MEDAETTSVADLLGEKMKTEEGMSDKESGANIASSIMIRVPTHRLSMLRKEFESSPTGGLDLANFLQSFVKNMDLPSDDALLRIVPDLVDFFNQVDINGDGNMEWSEFVMFVIEQVVSETDFKIDESLQLVGHMPIQVAASRQAVRVSKVFQGISRIFVGVDECVKIYELVEDAPDWLVLNVAVPLSKVKKEEPAEGEKKKMAKVDEAPIVVLDMAFISSKDVLVVLRSDLCLEFLRFSTRAKFSPETVTSLGVKKLDQPLAKLAIRDIPKEPIKLLSIGASKNIRVQLLEFNPSGMIEMFDDEPLVRHTDYVRDVIVIFTEMHKYIVSCGMDSRVLLWDVYTLKFKASRTGHVAGVECLAYDGKSVLLAGGFDYSVIGWDLDAEIDKPIFHLVGHSGTVMKCVGLGAYDRCVSVDNTGEIRFWDTSKSNPNDGIDRQIHDVLFIEDKMKSFDVLNTNGGKFETVNGIVIAAQGRKQHVYRICDLSVKPSPPVTAVVSPGLLMLISVHVKEVIFWDIVTGYYQSSLTNVCSASSEILCAILDDRKRKLIIGDSLGVVSVYNCLSGVKLKSFPSLPYAVRFMIYSPDKLVIVVAGIGDIYIFDESQEDTAKVLIRETKGTENDTVAVAFSQSLGYIATADCSGALYIWSYEFMTLEAVINDCTGTEIGQLTFLDPFPLLLVTDKSNNFTLILTKPMSEQPMMRRLWRVETIIPVKIKVAVVKSLFDGIGEDSMGLVESEGASVEKKDDDDDYYPLSDDDNEDDEMSTTKPLSRRHMNKFLLQNRDAKSIGIVMEGLQVKQSDDDNDAELINKIQLMTKIKEPEDDIYKGLDDVSLAADDATLSATLISESDVPLIKDPNAIPASFKCLINLGFDDGYMATVDLTPAILSIGLGPVREKDKVYNQERWNSRRCCVKAPKSGEIAKATWTAKQTSGKNEGFANCHLRKVWKAHNSNVNSLNFLDGKQVISTSDDFSIKLWDYGLGMQKAVLTRGKDMDKLIRPRWTSPINMIDRELKRAREARIFVEQLNLKRVFIPMPKDGMVFGRSEKVPKQDTKSILKSDKGNTLASSHSMGHLALSTRKSSTAIISDSDIGNNNNKNNNNDNNDNYYNNVTADGDIGNNLVKQKSSNTITKTRSSVDFNIGESRKESSQSGSLNLRETKYAIDETEPVVSRTVGQLKGRITYHMSNKEITKAELSEKEEFKKLEEVERNKRNKKKKKDVNGDAIVEKSEEALYLDELMSGDYSLKKKQEDGKKSRLDQLVNPSKDRKIRTKYDIDLDQLDASDPTNWEIQSMNRQRSLYPDLYFMLDKNGFTKDLVQMIQDRLNELSPNKDFLAFVEVIKNERKKAKSMLTKKKDKAPESELGTLALSEENVNMIATLSTNSPLRLDLAGVVASQALYNYDENKDNLTGLLKKDTDKAANPREEGKPWYGPFVCSKPLIAKERSDNEEKEEEVIIRCRDALPLLEKACMSPVHPFRTSKPVELAVHEIIHSKSLPDISKFHTKREYVEIRNMVVNTSYSNLVPVPRNLRLINNTDLVDVREARQAVIETFFKEINDIEKVAKKSNRQRKRDRKIVKKMFRQQEENTDKKIPFAEDDNSGAEFKERLENLMPRHRAVKLTFDKVESLDDLINVGRIQESIDLHLKKKVEFARKSFETLMSKMNNPNSNPSKMQDEEAHRKKEKDERRAKSKDDTTNKASNDDFKMREERRLLGLHEFGPYKASELLKLYYLIQDPHTDKKIVVVKESAEKQLEETMRLMRLEEEEREKEEAAIRAQRERDSRDFEDSEEEDNDSQAESRQHTAISDANSKMDTKSRPSGEQTKGEEKRNTASAGGTRAEWAIAEKHIEMVNLAKLLDTAYMKQRPSFRKDLNAYLNKRADGVVVLRHHVYATFEEIISYMCPFMTGKLRKDFFRYVELKTYVAPKDVKAVDDDAISTENMARLKVLFNFFDLDKSGGVDVNEIMIGLKKAGKNQSKEGGSGGGGLEIDQDAIKKMMDSVDAGKELSFDQFCLLFKNVL